MFVADVVGKKNSLERVGWTLYRVSGINTTNYHNSDNGPEHVRVACIMLWIHRVMMRSGSRAKKVSSPCYIAVVASWLRCCRYDLVRDFGVGSQVRKPPTTKKCASRLSNSHGSNQHSGNRGYDKRSIGVKIENDDMVIVPVLIIAILKICFWSIYSNQKEKRKGPVSKEGKKQRK